MLTKNFVCVSLDVRTIACFYLKWHCTIHNIHVLSALQLWICIEISDHCTTYTYRKIQILSSLIVNPHYNILGCTHVHVQCMLI